MFCESGIEEAFQYHSTRNPASASTPWHFRVLNGDNVFPAIFSGCISARHYKGHSNSCAALPSPTFRQGSVRRHLTNNRDHLHAYLTVILIMTANKQIVCIDADYSVFFWSFVIKGCSQTRQIEMCCTLFVHQGLWRERNRDLDWNCLRKDGFNVV